MKKFSGKVGIKCHQSCTVSLVFCTKLYIKLPVSLCSFSQFSFPFKRLMPWSWNLAHFPCLFSNNLLAIFDIFFLFKNLFTVLYWKMGQKWHAGAFLNKTLFQKRIKKIQSKVLSSQVLLAEETKRLSVVRPVFNLKAIEFGSFFAHFHLFRHLKVIQTFQKNAKTFYFRQAFRQNKPFEDSPSGFKIRF